jgi:integrase
MASVVRVKGIKRYRHPKTGRWYCYHRKSGAPIMSEFGSAAFFAELAELERSSKTTEALPGSLGHVMRAYMRSAEWGSLRQKTRFSYERALEILKPLEGMPLHKITRPFVFALRDTKILPKRGAWHANYAVTVMRILLGFAHDRGWIPTNPLSDRIKKIKIARRGGPANRPWSADECRVVLERAPSQLAIPIALAMFSGLRKSDVLSATTAAIHDGEITVRTSKRGRQISVPLHPTLMGIIARRPKSDAVQIAVNSHGSPWTESGFNASFRTFKIGLENENVIGKGLTLHGLRHTLGTRLREAGADDRTIGDILGQKSTAMARHYSESAQLPQQARELLMNLDPTRAKNKS